MPRVDGTATAFCDKQVAKPEHSPNKKGGCRGCIGVDPSKISYGTYIKVYEIGTNNLIYEGIACDYCGKACKRKGYLVDVWLEDDDTCYEWGDKKSYNRILIRFKLSLILQ